jgi:beta-lactamase superfamily II metal-dependent hydrolase
MKKICLLGMAILSSVSILHAADTLDMYVIDTEGGKALLLVSPAGESMLIDAGFPGNNDRDTLRIEEAAKAAGVKRFDYLVVTHYDLDHVNNVPATVARIPAGTFVDHGPAAVHDPGTTAAVKAYDAVVAKAKHLVVKAGDKIPFAGVDVLVVTAAGQALKTPLAGGGAPNPFCDSTPPMTWKGTNEDESENAQSVGLLLTFGRFRLLDLADLTWNKERALMCPNNPIGTVDLFMVSHHGNDISNSPALVHALRPRVAIMNNGARKIGAPAALKVIRSSPGLEALYQLHWSVRAGAEGNAPDEFIANLQNSPDGKWIKVSASPDGSFVVTNGRTGSSRTFQR